MNDPLAEKIKQLKYERNAVILAHNYQLPEVQEIADFTGDSLELARTARETNCDVIVFCGVNFMAETAHILNPEKTVLMPDPTAGCPMADMIDRERLIVLKNEHPDAIVVCYVNTHADVKAESDVCCTSANAANVVKAIGNGGNERPVLFIPDRHLGAYVNKVTGQDLILAPGYCPTHMRVIMEDIEQIMRDNPGAELIAHPECTKDVIDAADHVCSTSQMKKAVEKSEAKKFIIGTEVGMLHVLRKNYPDREFITPSPRCVCPNMKRNTLEKILWALEEMQFKVELDAKIRVKALNAIDRMLDYV